MDEPRVIQGGMGVAVSGWPLARAVALRGGLGVVSGTALDVVHARRLGDGDPGGHLQRAYAHFPNPGVAERVLERYLTPGGLEPSKPYRKVPMFTVDPSRELIELCVLANFAEVWLAKEGHHGVVGVNHLEKVQLPLMYALLGAVLAGVDYVLIGAGIPLGIPGMLDRLSRGDPVQRRVPVAGGEEAAMHLDPRSIVSDGWPRPRPRFLAIVASHTLAAFLARNPEHRPDGFVVEGPAAGGHNAPPRGEARTDERGNLLYGERDAVDLEKLAAIGLPFWLAGGEAGPDRLSEARARGATGVQVGTAFAFCEESGLEAGIRKRITTAGEGVEVRTDPLASPSGYPFKVVQLPGTVSEPEVYAARRRVCDLGYLRTVVRGPTGELEYRCPAEPVQAYARKGGDKAETVGRRCLCNGLMAAAGHPQRRAGHPEPPIVTAGDDLSRVVGILMDGRGSYTAGDVIDWLLSAEPSEG